MELILTTGGASGNWKSDVGANNEKWGAAATGGEWNTGAADSDGFTSQDARAGRNGFEAATDGQDAGGDGNCRNCGQGEQRVITMPYDRR